MPKYSQIFLKNADVAARIAGLLDSMSFDYLVEIGPGKGVLTRFLLKYAPNLCLVEIDKNLVEFLNAEFRNAGLKICAADFLEFNPDKELAHCRKPAFIGNLPYDCATAILEKTLLFDKFHSAVFMFQKEVGEKITAKTGDSDFGYFSVFCQTLSIPSKLMEIKASDFLPAPKVDSAALTFEKQESAAGELNTVEKKREFSELVKMAFRHRRKTVLNSLSASMAAPRPAIEKLLAGAGIDPAARPQNLSVQDYLKLFNLYKKSKIVKL
ncbi:MAG: ribosomal RNA small subunit methyltransferase A [Elusimicrobia bacterium]|nr:ribosomal RNA small subunit methyltransferase A [Elusimicrobiota bacterium]